MKCFMDKQQITNLIKKYGSPLYVFHDAEFIENYEHLCRAMRGYYPNYNPGYSITRPIFANWSNATGAMLKL